MNAREPSSGAWSAVGWALERDVRLALRSKTELGVQILFYVIVVTLYPLGVGAEPALLRALGPGVLWVAAPFWQRFRRWNAGADRALALSSARVDLG